METNKENEKRLFVRLAEISNSQAGFIPNEYLLPIVDKYWEDIKEDISETADPDNWNSDDMRIAFGRFLCDKLGVEI